MNSDPHESAAWRAFGMLDADEAAGFDESMRHDPELKKAYLEMESLTAVVAAASVKPVAPRTGQLERLERQLGLHAARRTNWPAISGWAAAAASVTLLLLVNRNAPETENTIVVTPPAAITKPSEAPAPERVKEISTKHIPRFKENSDFAEAALEGEPIVRQDEMASTVTRQETRQLIQEIEILQEKLHDLQQLDRERFEAVPGTAWPIVMRMSPPGVPAEPSDIAFEHEETPMTAILGDALASAGDPYDEGVGKAGIVSEKPSPSAVPIYDAARDTGILVVNYLPSTSGDEAYNLWVKTEADGKPIHLGKLPQSNARAADSFDFSLGSVGIVPSGFILTRDPGGKPSPPGINNTILQGP